MAYSRRVVMLCTTLVWGCATSGAGSAEMGAIPFRETVGNATAIDVERKTRQVLERYHYELVRTETTRYSMYFETHWRQRAPFEDEEALGISAARSRIIVRGRSRTRGAGGTTGLMVVEFTMENLVLDEDSGQWRQVVVTNMFRAYAKEIANRLKDEFTSGIRVF